MKKLLLVCSLFAAMTFGVVASGNSNTTTVSISILDDEKPKACCKKGDKKDKECTKEDKACCKDGGKKGKGACCKDAKKPAEAQKDVPTPSNKPVE
jgi:hypothetical protein